MRAAARQRAIRALPPARAAWRRRGARPPPANSPSSHARAQTAGGGKIDTGGNAAAGAAEEDGDAEETKWDHFWSFPSIETEAKFSSFKEFKDAFFMPLMLGYKKLAIAKGACARVRAFFPPSRRSRLRAASTRRRVRRRRRRFHRAVRAVRAPAQACARTRTRLRKRASAWPRWA